MSVREKDSRKWIPFSALLCEFWLASWVLNSNGSVSQRHFAFSPHFNLKTVWGALPHCKAHSFLGIQLPHVILGRMEANSTYRQGTALSTSWTLWLSGDNFRVRHNLYLMYLYSMDFYVHNSPRGSSKSIWRPRSAQSLNYYSVCFAY